VATGKRPALSVGFGPELVAADTLFLGLHLLANPVQFPDRVRL